MCQKHPMKWEMTSQMRKRSSGGHSTEDTRRLGKIKVLYGVWGKEGEEDDCWRDEQVSGNEHDMGAAPKDRESTWPESRQSLPWRHDEKGRRRPSARSAMRAGPELPCGDGPDHEAPARHGNKKDSEDRRVWLWVMGRCGFLAHHIRLMMKQFTATRNSYGETGLKQDRLLWRCHAGGGDQAGATVRKHTIDRYRLEGPLGITENLS